MKRLIVNADDFGLTPGINRAIVDLAAAGALTSATLMANGSAYDNAVALALGAPLLSIGCHVVLIDGSPVAPPDQIRTLTRTGGNFYPTLSSFAAALFRGNITASAIEEEAVAQIRKLQASGLRVDHIDTHKHTHIFPAVLKPLLRAMTTCGVPAIRNPFEPAWSARLVASSTMRRAQVDILRAAYRRTFQRLCTESGIVTTDGAIGVATTGSLDAVTLRKMLTRLPEGDHELVCHPGKVDAALSGVRTRLRASREVEHAALLEVLPQMVKAGHLTLTSFAQLAG